MSVPHAVSATLSTLAAFKPILVAGPTMTRGGKLLSVRGAASLFSLTAGDGPLIWGVAQKGLSVVQLEEYLEAAPVTPSAVDSVEKANRGARVRHLGVLVASADGTTASDFVDNVGLSGLKFSEEEAGWNYWLYNLGKALTTGSSAGFALVFFVEFNPSG